MNSPIEPGSPTLSTPSSGSDVEEISLPPSSSFPSGLVINSIGSFNNTVPSSATSSSSKRRLNPGSVSSRDPRDSKSRRRDDPHHYAKGAGGEGERERDRERQGGRGANYEMQKEKREKDELLDMGAVEFLRKEIGDPFVEISFE
ncbi:hypothetical protein F5879DRAFT_989701 [Lentinula edodes]|uniref:Uncharacterized protein n=1 Tax=Lentinula lateritia TaxID=40482 RepID=A0A9W9AHE1_9AGAR|nr:hypothetical protein F5051DRAFT_409131 [Lentinula edodes]KAJ3903869.1 hypothetical protein F5879DRAFT_989701 [Lentinula edodes]KAJ3916116.1 hypothetical protein F5877DRAFT_81201 [Lentinula edodes]KAJ4482937.1 hypothetical protein C8J55DRAFT_46888 [Lentinula edodes]